MNTWLSRRAAVVTACILAACMVVGFMWLSGSPHEKTTANSSDQNERSATIEQGSALAGNPYPPCGIPSQELVTLTEATRQFGSVLLLPSDPNANNEIVKTVAICSADEPKLIVVYNNGVWADESSWDGPDPDPEKQVADDPNESEVGTVNGKSVFVITPTQGRFPRDGAVYMKIGDRQVIVVGNTSLSVDEMEAIAASIPSQIKQ